ncbi:MAG TPA: hypothetical protein VLB76_18955 [Thermoanaerobaculia bacterium]|jgi:hypothetical protein|nr:hypothetical protein [Thermoanaerobaculia bacterium]
MKNDKPMESTEPPAPPTTGVRAQTTPDPARPFLEAYNAYLLRLNDGWEAAHKSLKGTSREHNDAQVSLHDEMEKSSTEAQRQFTEEVQKISTGSTEDLQRAAAEAQQRYQSALSSAEAGAVRRWDALRNDLQETIATSQKSYAEHCKSAYKGYLADLKRAWQSIDVEALDPATVARINALTAHAMQYAWYTGAS